MRYFIGFEWGVIYSFSFKSIYINDFYRDTTFDRSAVSLSNLKKIILNLTIKQNKLVAILYKKKIDNSKYSLWKAEVTKNIAQAWSIAF